MAGFYSPTEVVLKYIEKNINKYEYIEETLSNGQILRIQVNENYYFGTTRGTKLIYSIEQRSLTYSTKIKFKNRISMTGFIF